MIAVTTETRLEGYEIAAYKGTAQGATFADLLRHAEALGANAILNTCYDDALDVETLFHGAAVVIERVAPRRPAQPVAGGTTEKLPAQTTMTGGMI
jgi:uncharacterized protein YbjQ (UPF0145 family)